VAVVVVAEAGPQVDRLVFSEFLPSGLDARSRLRGGGCLPVSMVTTFSARYAAACAETWSANSDAGSARLYARHRS
jgi:hypothetical protein